MDIFSTEKPIEFTSWCGLSAGSLAALLFLSATDPALSAGGPPLDRLSVPAEFVTQLVPPGTSNHLRRPSAIFVDGKFGEVLVADPGNNRIVIFDRGGTYRYEFSGNGYFSVPVDLVVDSRGFIYVLGSTAQGRRVFRFDFDGMFQGEVPVKAPVTGQDPLITDIAIDATNTLFVLDEAGQQVSRHDLKGRLLGAFPLLEGMDPRLKREQTFGSIAIRADTVLVPVPTLGAVYLYAKDGEFVRAMGHKGTNVGELNFPTAVAVTGDDLVLVLDKHRYNVVCFDMSGRFHGEFGGMGARPGWFYHPTLLAVDDEHQVYVGQIFENRVQVCRIPDSITARYHREGVTGQTDNDKDGSAIATEVSGEQPREEG